MSQKTARSKIIVGNWKMYKTIEETVNYIETLTPLIHESQAAVYLAVPFTAIQPAAEKVRALQSPIKIGAQNMNDASEGAFTGEIAARMLLDAGAQFVILGHSERRHIFHETNAFIHKKLKRALADQLQPILCIGETLEERESDQLGEILKNQIHTAFQEFSTEELYVTILAYEPVWAIGTGKVAQTADVEKAHQLCRLIIKEKWGEEAASKSTILYGGSVNGENAEELLSQQGVDGLLVGGASLSPQVFSQIINQVSVTI